MDDSIEYFADLQRQVEAAQRLLTEKVKICFTGKDIATIKEIIKDDEQDILLWLIDIGLEHESYEICAAAKRVIEERKLATVPRSMVA